MSVENPKPNLRTSEEVVKYLKEKNLLKTEEKLVTKVIDNLLKLSKTFNPNNPSHTMKMYYEMGQMGLKLTDEQCEILFKELTGYGLEDLQVAEVYEGEPDVIISEVVEHEGEHEGEPEGEGVEIGADIPKNNSVPIKTEKRKSLINIIADAKITDLTVSMAKFTVKSYSNVKKDKSTLGNILKGTGLGALALTTVIGGSGAILAARALRLAGKGLKAAKGTAEKALHNKAVKTKAQTEQGLVKQKDELEQLAEVKRKDLDATVQAFGRDAEAGYKTIVAFRDGKMTPEDCEKIILSEYDSVSEIRDQNLSRMANFDIIAELQEKYGLDADQIATLISGITIEKDKIVYPEGLGIEFKEEDEALLRVAMRNEAVIFEAPEDVKIKLFEYLEFKDGQAKLKEGVDLEAMPSNVAKIAKIILNNKTMDKSLAMETLGLTETVTVLIMAEEEILINSILEANREMTEVFANKSKTITEEQKGFVKSSIEAITATSLRAKAKGLVERRLESHIQDTIIRNGDASERLLALAREKLLDTPANAIEKDSQVLGDNAPAVEGHDEK